MNTIKSKNKLMATMIIMLLFASTMLAVVPTAFAFNAHDPIVPNFGPVGTLFNVAGEADASDNTITVYFGNDDTGTVLGTEILGGSGDENFAFVTTVGIPSMPAGVYNIYIEETDTASALIDSWVTTFTVVPKIDLGVVTTAYAGDPIAVTGTGFAANSNVEFYLDSTSIGSIMTDADGELSGNLVMPYDTVTDSYYVSAIDGDNNHSASITLGVILLPTIILDKNVARPSTPFNDANGFSIVAVTGIGFDPDVEVTITFDGAAMNTDSDTVKTDANGCFTATFIVPASANTAGNPYAVVAEDESGNIHSRSIDIAPVIGLFDPLTGLEISGGPTGLVVIMD